MYLDIIAEFDKITYARVKSSKNVLVKGMVDGKKEEKLYTYQHSGVAKEVAKRIRNFEGI